MLVRPQKKEPNGLRATLLEVRSPSPHRRQAPCPHFGRCGGCGLQHLSENLYRDWKRGLVVTALEHRGFAAAEELVGPLKSVPAGCRRRVNWAAFRSNAGTALGFHERGGHLIVDQESCLLLTPPLAALLAPLRRLLEGILAQGSGAELHATDTDAGIDLLLRLPADPGLREREALAAFAATEDLARLSVQLGAEEVEPLAQRRAPSVSVGGVAVTPLPGQFLQPSKEGEALLRAEVYRAIASDDTYVADLFSGCGTFTLPLARRGSRVLAVEADAGALGALEEAARANGLAGRVACLQRNLMRAPLQGDDLAGLTALVFDPPRAGASAQCQALAGQGPAKVVAVSCNPASFARDARILVGLGYRLDWVTPVDQFPWSHHLELVASFVL